jgi:O-antigen/teichoic acid export membrane protein
VVEAQVGSESGGARKSHGVDLTDLRRRALGGSFWTVFGLVATNLLRLAGNVVLARLLFPEAFGLMALAQVVIQGLWLFSDVGTGPAIIQSKRGDDPAFLDTAWTLQLARGCALCLVTFAFAVPVSSFYGATDPLARDLVYYLPALGLSAIMDGAVSTRLHSYGRHLKVRQLTLLALFDQAVGVVVMVAVAWVHPSVWALIAGTLVRCALRAVLSHKVLEGPRNRLRWDRDAGHALLRFGKWVFVSTMLTFLATQADRLIFGRLVTLEQLGVYGMALALAGMPVFALTKVGSTIVFPVLSRLGRGAQQTREAVRVRGLLVVGGAAFLSAILPAGPLLIELLYDPRYAAAGWILQLLLVGGWFQVLEAPNTSFLLARGETRLVALGNGAKLVGIAALLPLGFALHGFAGAIAGVALADAAKYLTTAALVRRRGLPVLLLDLATSVLVLAACLLGSGAGSLAREGGAGVLLALLVSAGVGGAPWVGVAALGWRCWPQLRDAVAVARPS